MAGIEQVTSLYRQTAEELLARRPGGGGGAGCSAEMRRRMTTSPAALGVTAKETVSGVG